MQESAAASVPPSAHLKFPKTSPFRRALKQRADAYFAATGLKERDQPAMYVKSAILLVAAALTWSLLVFAPIPLWARLLLCIPMGLASAGIGFSVMHDAGHGAYSSNPRINHLMFLTLDLMGASSYVWRFKHNTLHHTYANIHGHDDDIDIGLLGRMSPEQPRLGFHRFQHLYIWVLYGLLAVKWHLWDDFATWFKGRMGVHAMPRPKGMDAVTLVAGKLVFFALAFVIPSFFFPIWGVIAFYMAYAAVEGLVMATIFQLAHCVQEAAFPVPEEGGTSMGHEWAVHQVLTTVDFSPGNRLISWYVGGLNYQIEHHLFPRISHIHYPALSSIVRETCEEFGLPYHVTPSFWQGVRSHFALMRDLGRPLAA